MQMTTNLQTETPRPLVTRCAMCPRPISQSRVFCLACYERFLARYRDVLASREAPRPLDALE